jgi:hypothetical protein
MSDRKSTVISEWGNYTQVYGNQLERMEGRTGSAGSEFLVTNWNINEGGDLIISDKIHRNWRFLYTKISELSPKSVFECGCGAMYHLQNIKGIFPEISVGGCDLLQSQIDLGKKKFEISDEVTKNVFQRDFSVELEDSGELGSHEFVYSHAVMMHLNGDAAQNFLANMLKISSKYVFFLEDVEHDYIEMLKKSGEGNRWKVSVFEKESGWLFTKIEK